MTGEFARPRMMSDPMPVWLYLDCLKWILIICGYMWLTLQHPPSPSSSSLRQKKPNNTVQVTAHTKFVWVLGRDYCALVYVGVIGNLTCGLALLAKPSTAVLNRWSGFKTCSCRELESLIGLLSHACKVVLWGHSFLRCMINLLHAVPRPAKNYPSQSCLSFLHMDVSKNPNYNMVWKFQCKGKMTQVTKAFQSRSNFSSM